MIRLWFDISTHVKLWIPQQATEYVQVYTLLDKSVNAHSKSYVQFYSVQSHIMFHNMLINWAKKFYNWQTKIIIQMVNLLNVSVTVCVKFTCKHVVE